VLRDFVRAFNERPAQLPETHMFAVSYRRGGQRRVTALCGRVPGAASPVSIAYRRAINTGSTSADVRGTLNLRD